MEKTEITCHAELLERIQYLKSDKLRQEEHLKRSFQDIVFNFGLSSLMNRPVNVHAEEDNFLLRLVRGSLNMAFNFVINLVFGKHQKLKLFLSSLLVPAFSALLVNRNIARIMVVVRRFFVR